jgi:mRNA interferase MazF
MTTAAYNSDNPFAVTLGKVAEQKTGVGKIDKTSYVLCHQPKSFDWQLRGAKPHPLGTLNNALFVQVCKRLNQIIQLV